MNRRAAALVCVGPGIRDVATYLGGELEMDQRPDLSSASSSESDRYEELLVNPTLLTLLSQRGKVDCGGLEYVLVRYGNFFQFVQQVPGGHVSVALESTVHLETIVGQIRAVLETHGREAV